LQGGVTQLDVVELDGDVLGVLLGGVVEDLCEVHPAK
jgi:hypothetical protein